MKTVVIEDDPDVLEAISLSFRMGWPQVNILSTSEAVRGVELVRTESPDIVLLDLLLPDANGFHVLSQIRAFSDVPLIIATVKGEEIERVRGLELGADDYIVKPFSYMELLARVRAVLRRSSPTGESALPTSFEHGGLVINFKSQDVKLDGREIKLTPTEYNLLCQLALNAGRIVSQKALIDKVWGEEYRNAPNVLKVHVHRLRRKLRESPDAPRAIVTVPGRGYKLQVLAQASFPTVGQTVTPVS
jgi:two-component system response regulator VicR